LCFRKNKKIFWLRREREWEWWVFGSFLFFWWGGDWKELICLSIARSQVNVQLLFWGYLCIWTVNDNDNKITWTDFDGESSRRAKCWKGDDRMTFSVTLRKTTKTCTHRYYSLLVEWFMPLHGLGWVGLGWVGFAKNSSFFFFLAKMTFLRLFWIKVWIIRCQNNSSTYKIILLWNLGTIWSLS